MLTNKADTTIAMSEISVSGVLTLGKFFDVVHRLTRSGIAKDWLGVVGTTTGVWMQTLRSPLPSLQMHYHNTIGKPSRPIRTY